MELHFSSRAFLLVCCIICISLYGVLASFVVHVCLSSWLPALDMKIDFLYRKRGVFVILLFVSVFVESLMISCALGFGALGMKSRSLGLAGFFIFCLVLPLLGGSQVATFLATAYRAQHTAARRICTKGRRSLVSLSLELDAAEHEAEHASAAAVVVHGEQSFGLSPRGS